ncbi:hypothetical protein JCM24511_03392 [Saitozyma sp. JCM 24511]|nr:hypothetical protein JCM24511_03392 [Saitozyma sp. JCM 24511]
MRTKEEVESASQGHTTVDFVQVDLTLISGMKTFVEEIETAVGPKGVNYLTISRFYVAYHLTTRGLLAPGAPVLSVCGPGLTLDYLRVDDLNLAEQVESGISKQSLFFAQSARESCILDAVHMELNERFPQYRYYHVAPVWLSWCPELRPQGIVRTEGLATFPAPFPINYLMKLGSFFIGTSPAEYAAYPVYAAVAGKDALGEARFFDATLKEKEPGKWASSEANRKALWKKLLDITADK